MKRRLRTNLVAVGALAALACVDLSAPKGPASISTLLLPALFVVQGDVMRDSLGNQAPPTIIAYDQKGNQISGVAASFFFTDSIPRAHFDQSGIIHGDSLGVAHLVGQIGNIQTDVFNLPITVAPDSMARVLVGVADTLRATVGTDSASSRAQLAVQVRVTGANNTPVQGVRVTFMLVPPTLASRVSAPAVYLTIPQSDNLSQVDTTDASGLASRGVTLISSRIADQTIFSGRVDSVVVRAEARYRGASLRGSPLNIAIPVKVGFQ